MDYNVRIVKEYSVDGIFLVKAGLVLSPKNNLSEAIRDFENLIYDPQTSQSVIGIYRTFIVTSNREGETGEVSEEQMLPDMILDTCPFLVQVGYDPETTNVESLRKEYFEEDMDRIKIVPYAEMTEMNDGLLSRYMGDISRRIMELRKGDILPGISSGRAKLLEEVLRVEGLGKMERLSLNLKDTFLQKTFPSEENTGAN